MCEDSKRNLSEEINHLAKKSFSIIELIEASDISEPIFLLVRRKLLNLGNDILRLENSFKDGDING